MRVLSISNNFIFPIFLSPPTRKNSKFFADDMSILHYIWPLENSHPTEIGKNNKLSRKRKIDSFDKN